jgi:putative nucleotidyltransferase with HDIG domain
MKRYFKTDFKRIGHASRVARYAERIGRNEKGNMAVILAAAYLHDIGKVAAEKKFGPAAAEHHETEGGKVARAILTKLGARQEMIDTVCEIIAHHHQPQYSEDINFRVVYDADLLDRLDQKRKKDPDGWIEWSDALESDFQTDSGRQTAREILTA